MKELSQVSEHLPVDSPVNKPGVRLNNVNLHSKQPSGIATRLRSAGIDWVADLAAALKANDAARIAVWLKLLPYLVVSGGKPRAAKPKRRASKAALEALNELEGKGCLTKL